MSIAYDHPDDCQDRHADDDELPEEQSGKPHRRELDPAETPDDGVVHVPHAQLGEVGRDHRQGEVRLQPQLVANAVGNLGL